MDLQLNDKTAVITGATAGIGLEIARKLAVEGAEAILTGRSQAKLDAAVANIQACGGVRVRGVLADAATAEGAAALLTAVPRVDILVNNLASMKQALRGHHRCRLARHFRGQCAERRPAGPRLFPGHAGAKLGPSNLHLQRVRADDPREMIHYGMTKTAQLSISRGLAQLTRGTAVTVNSVLPGPTRSRASSISCGASPPIPPPRLTRSKPSSLLNGARHRCSSG
jgi:NAD(P)-dependent dehydrogenase (short-subunit alcohol dehydrogenase family)